MGPIIVLDKSVFQSLSFNEVIFLNKYYTLNITPILILEILGNLKKEFKDGAKPEIKVKEYADKLLQADSIVNVNYKELLKSSLFGYHFPMDGRPVVGNPGKIAKNEKGEEGVILEVSEEEKTIDRWRLGNFQKSEEILAEKWRNSVDMLDIKQFQNKYKTILGSIGQFGNLNELKYQLEILLSKKELQKLFLELIIYEFGIQSGLAAKVFYRWEIGKYEKLQSFSPYAFYCFEISLLFYLGLSAGLIKNDPKNKIDLEYFYYLPFAMVFSSSDKFHSQMIEILLKDNKIFIEGQSLKQDLGNIYKEWHSLNEEDKKEWNKKNNVYPPLNPNSPTLKCWEKLMRPRKDVGKEINLTPEQESDMVKKINNIVNSNKNVDSSKKMIDEYGTEFMIRKRKIRGIDPCPCNSGKRFYECCLHKIEEKKRQDI